jgi:hypothetical protein
MKIFVANGDYASEVLAIVFLLINVMLAVVVPIYLWKHKSNYDAKEPLEFIQTPN